MYFRNFLYLAKLVRKRKRIHMQLNKFHKKRPASESQLQCRFFCEIYNIRNEKLRALRRFNSGYVELSSTLVFHSFDANGLNKSFVVVRFIQIIYPYVLAGAAA